MSVVSLVSSVGQASLQGQAGGMVPYNQDRLTSQRSSEAVEETAGALLRGPGTPLLLWFGWRAPSCMVLLLTAVASFPGDELLCFGTASPAGARASYRTCQSQRLTLAGTQNPTPCPQGRTLLCRAPRGVRLQTHLFVQRLCLPLCTPHSPPEVPRESSLQNHMRAIPRLWLCF